MAGIAIRSRQMIRTTIDIGFTPMYSGRSIEPNAEF